MTLTMARMYSKNRKPSKRNEYDFLTFWKEELEQMSSVHILHWAVEHYYPRLALKTAFEPEGCVLLSLLSNIAPKIMILCSDIDYQMQYFWRVTNRFFTQTGLEIVRVASFDTDIESRTHFDAVLDGTRRQGRPGIGVLGMNQTTEIPSVSPLVRWSHDALVQKLKRDAILDSSFINIWNTDR